MDRITLRLLKKQMYRARQQRALALADAACRPLIDEKTFPPFEWPTQAQLLFEDRWRRLLAARKWQDARDVVRMFVALWRRLPWWSNAEGLKRGTE